MARYLIRNIKAGTYIETFLISAVSSVLIIRFFLYITDYPQLGGNGLHIAHMLWGGLLMMVAIILFISFLGEWIIRAGSVIGGIGFGAFIDELGKFITSDNNYFYQPSIALIYLVFVTLFIIYRYLDKEQVLSSKEYIMNSIEELEEVVFNDLDKEEQKSAINLLKSANTHDPTVKQLISIISEFQVISSNRNSNLLKIKNIMRKYYLLLINNKAFQKIIIIFFVSYAIYFIVTNPTFLIAAAGGFISNLELYGQLELITSLISFFLIILGTVFLPSRKLSALRYYKWAIIISILVTQFFVFYREQLSAVFTLILNVIVLVVLNYMIGQEELLKAKI